MSDKPADRTYPLNQIYFYLTEGWTFGVDIAGLRLNIKARLINILRWIWIFSNQSSDRQSHWVSQV